MKRANCRSSRRFWLAAVLACPFIAYGAFQLIMFLHRPMFYNVFGRNDRMPFCMWVEGPCHFDQRDNVAIADYRLNLLVVFLTDNGALDLARFIHPSSGVHGAVFPDPDGRDNLDFHVRRRQNTLIVFHPDGSRREFPLAEGEAEAFHGLLSEDPEDFRPLLIELYAQSDSAQELAGWLGEVN